MAMSDRWKTGRALNSFKIAVDHLWNVGFFSCRIITLFDVCLITASNGVRWFCILVHMLDALSSSADVLRIFGLPQMRSCDVSFRLLRPTAFSPLKREES